jgi:hypothetical protein
MITIDYSNIPYDNSKMYLVSKKDIKTENNFIMKFGVEYHMNFKIINPTYSSLMRMMPSLVRKDTCHLLMD